MGTKAPSYLEILNPEQQKAVLHSGHPLLILAGAGSGKTRVITTKIAWLIREQGFDPLSILAVTFTNKAAREMADRARQIDDRASFAMLRTFHSFGAWFLRRYGNASALASNFVIYDDEDSMALLSTLMEGMPRAEIKELANKIARAKDYFLSPGDPELDLIDPRVIFKTVYARYEERLSQIGNVDFGDLIKKPVEILRSNPRIASRLHDKFKVIMVDEYQDANVAQSELLKELYSPGSYLCVVGDDDQSIYRFRGAEVKNILSFPDTFKDTDIVRLERNYRSSASILKLASSVVANNKDRLGKELKAERGDGKVPVLAFLPDQDTESEFCAELITKAAKGLYSDWAIVYRTNAQSLGFETEFLRRKIPYRLIGSLKFYEREEVKDILALLAFLVNPRDEVAFRRIVNKPSRGIGSATVTKIIEHAILMGIDIGDAAGNIAPHLSAKARSGINTFLKTIEKGKAALIGDSMYSSVSGADESLKAGVGLSICVVSLALGSGIAEYHTTRDELSGNQRLNNLQEVANAASLYSASMEGLLEFLEHIELDRSTEERSNDTFDNNAVTLITLHNTKGLEFKKVIITGIEQGIFPREDKKDGDLEEERRLFYVGATRAMDELYLCSCALRRMYGGPKNMEPSVFLKEIDPNYIQVIGRIPPGFRQNGEKHKNNVYRAKKSLDGKWTLGDKVYHDDHGYGSVMQIMDTDDDSIIKVVFETAYELRFSSNEQSSHFMKIKED